ncbi:Short-chain dehydrogenase iccH [Cladobotryum mycophilum]|uniref:Short-chain dehydrogenase iccH n=1 Tax=Cladobotryum mycophilum TaxID=491253 RepID=A0ABR0SF89_9HYPO
MSSTGSVLVTGANGGLGTAIVQQILKNPDIASTYTGLYAVRKAATASNLQAALRAAPKNHKYETVDIDLSSLSSVRKVAGDINSRVAKGELPKIRVLVLNAGYQDREAQPVLSGDGLEMTWQVNHLANMLLSLLLLQSMDEENGRILVLASQSHDVDDPRNTPLVEFRGITTLYPGAEKLSRGQLFDNTVPEHAGFIRYGSSKLAVVMFIKELANRIAKDPKLHNISVIGLDPGGMATDLGRNAGFLIRVVLMKIVLPLLAEIWVRVSPNGLLRPVWKSSSDVVRALFEIETPRGELLYLNGSDVYPIGKEAKDEEKRRDMWNHSLEAAKIAEGDTVLVDWK